MQVWRNKSAAILLFLSAVLAGCGGGGGGGADSGGGDVYYAIAPDSLTVTVSATDPAPTGTIDISIFDVPAEGLYYSFDFSTEIISSVDLIQTTDTAGVISVYFLSPSGLAAQTYTGFVTLYLCYDIDCNRAVTNTPRTISVTYVIESDTGTGSGTGTVDNTTAPLQTRSVQAMPHDVIDAEYSDALDSIVMVASYPANSLHILDTATGIERHVDLPKVPTSVSVGPDGLHAAVGHDALISYVDLAKVGSAATDIVTPLYVSTTVFDLVLAGNGYVHAFPKTDQWVNIHSVEIATNTETLGNGYIYDETRAKLHPGGLAMYGAENGIYPSDIEKFDINSGVASLAYDSPYHGDYEMCGNLWISENGLHIYTACGNTFRSSSVQNQDMLYNGALQLRTSTYANYQIGSLSQTAEQQEIMLVEVDQYCETWNSASGCNRYLNLYESLYLNRTATFIIPDMTVNAQSYRQFPMFVFHSADGTKRYLISKLDAMSNPDAEYYWSELQ